MVEMRKIKRKLSEVEAYELISKAKEITISMYDIEKAEPYAVIVNPIYFDKNIYIHCAKEGQKIDILKKNNNVCITSIIKSDIIENKYTTAYESVVISSHATFIENKEEKVAILNKLCEIFTPSNNSEMNQKIIISAVDNTTIIKFPIESISAKANR
ncbi:MAG: pyridoxamine 5'-phosphate oxidase family protein [Spirochaetaceae bacterium]|nr:pyridoxamine 5'-phosphate oxidase family protein [Spirochaetaceae bacterium]